MDENAGHLAGGGVAAHYDVGIAALLEVRIEDRFAGRALTRPPSPEQAAEISRGFSRQHPPQIVWFVTH